MANPGGFPVAWGPPLERLGFATAWGPLWQDFRENFYLPVLALLLVGAGVSCFNFLRPYWTRPRLGIRGLANLLFGALIFFALQGHLVEVQAQWIKMTGHNLEMSPAESVANWINIGMAIAMFSVGVICFLQELFEMVRIIRWKAAASKLTKATFVKRCRADRRAVAQPRAA